MSGARTEPVPCADVLSAARVSALRYGAVRRSGQPL
jgi:hypothetical protein